MRNFKRFLSLVLAVVMVAGMAVFAAPASSAAASSAAGYASSVEFLADLGVMKGYGDGNYGENDDVTRYQMALFFVRSIFPGWNAADEIPTQASEVFTDVKGYGAAIDAMAGLGIVNGVGDNLFAPESNILYRDAIVMAVRAVGITAAEQATLTYPWGYIVKANALGLTDGISGVSYSENLKRGDVARIIENVLKCELDDRGTTYLKTVLGAEDLGTYQLVATNNVALDGFGGLTTTKGEVKLNNGTDTKTAKVSNLKLVEGFDENSALSFKFAVSIVNDDVVVATMYDVITVENFGAKTYEVKDSGAKIKYDGKEYAADKFYTYGAGSETSAFAAASNIGAWGKVIFQKDENGKIAPAFYVPYNTMTSVWTVSNIKFNKDDKTINTIKGSDLKGKTTNLYVMPSANVYNFVADKISTKGNVNRMTVKGINGKSTSSYLGTDFGFYSEADSTKKRTGFDNAATIFGASDYGTTIVGDYKSGSIFLGNIYTVGNYTFMTVAKNMERTTAVGTFDYIANGKDAVVDGATIEVGADIPDTISGNYKLLTDLTTDPDAAETKYVALNTLVGEKLDLIYIDGKLVTATPWSEEGPKETYPDTFTDKFVISAANKTNIVNNGDGTFSMGIFNAKENKVDTIVVSSLNGKNIANLETTFGLAVAKDILNITDANVKTFADVVVYVITGGAATSATHVQATEKIGDENVTVTYAVLSAKEADGKYTLSTDLSKVAAISSPRVSVGDLSFTKYNTSSIAAPQYTKYKWDAAVSTGNVKEDGKAYLSVSADTTYVAIGSDGRSTLTGKLATASDKLNLAGAYIFELSNNFVFVMNTAKTAKSIIAIDGIASVNPVTAAGYYVLGPKAVNTKVTKNEDGKYVYTLENVVNFTKFVDTQSIDAAYETIAVVGTNVYDANILKTVFSSTKFGTTPDKVVSAWGNNSFYDPAKTGFDSGKVDKESNASHLLVKVDAEGNAVLSSYSDWAVENKYNIGTLEKVVKGDANTLEINGYDYDGTNYDRNTEKDVKVVVSYTATILNSSNSSGCAYEFNAAEKFSAGLQKGSTSYINKFTAQNDSAASGRTDGDGEAVFYKIDLTTGKADIILVWGDLFSSTEIEASANRSNP